MSSDMCLAEAAALPPLDDVRIAVIGLGYVGLPLAVELAKHFPVTGFDIDASRVAGLLAGKDDTLEVCGAELKAATRLRFTAEPNGISNHTVYIITVPTPIDERRCPDLGALLHASEHVGSNLSPGCVVIYESTVYPGATEEDCVPVLERCSGLTLNQDFFVGYSPERTNPGDKAHRLADVVKITSGSTPRAALFVDSLYARTIRAGTYLAASIRVAEAAKLIENTQRDINIAFVNELACIFGKLGMDTEEVLAAARSKWNFMPFQPGLVGGHCIGVAPYYLAHKASVVGYNSELVLAGRRVNTKMAAHVAVCIVEALAKRNTNINGARVLLLGLTYKEDCPDVRGTRVTDLIHELEIVGAVVDVHDICADSEEVHCHYGLTLVDALHPASYDAVVLAVPHSGYRQWGAERIRSLMRSDGIFFDMKSVFPASQSNLRL